MKAKSDLIFPFSALVGQDQMKTALLLNAINPKIGGALISGEKGTAKSMAEIVRRRLSFEEVTTSFATQWEQEQEAPLTI